MYKQRLYAEERVNYSPKTAEDIYPVMSDIIDLFREKKYSEVDTILASVPVYKCNPMLLLTYARVTYSARSKLKYWVSYTSEVGRYLKSRGEDYKRLMRGLI